MLVTANADVRLDMLFDELSSSRTTLVEVNYSLSTYLSTSWFDNQTTVTITRSILDYVTTSLTCNYCAREIEVLVTELQSPLRLYDYKFNL